MHRLSEAHSQFNLVALHAPGAADVARAFDTAVASLQKSGALAQILVPHGVEAPLGAGAPSTHTENANPLVVPAAYVAPGPADAPPALYSMAQAKQGAQKFADNCSQCHGDNLEGLSGPALTGANFASEKAASRSGTSSPS